MTVVESISIPVRIGKTTVSQPVDLCRRKDSPAIWLRVNRPGGKPIRRSLKTADLGEAKRRAHLAVQLIYDSAEWTPSGPGDSPLPIPTVQEFADGFEEWYHRESTAKAYARALVKVARLAGLDPTKTGIDRLDDSVIFRFLDTSENADYTRRTTALSARACFAPRHRRYWSERWTIPDCIESFRKAELPRRRLPEFRPLPDDVMDRIVAEAPELPRPLWRCHLMLRDIGLRSSEALAARKDWVERNRGEWFFTLEEGEFFKGKNAAALRRLPISADLAKELTAGPGPYIVEGESENERFDLVKRHHPAWLRQFFPTAKAYEPHRRHPNQALRRQFVERCIGELGWDIKTTANYTRHDPKTLLDWYAGGKIVAPPSRISNDHE